VDYGASERKRKRSQNKMKGKEKKKQNRPKRKRAKKETGVYYLEEEKGILKRKVKGKKDGPFTFLKKKEGGEGKRERNPIHRAG